MQSACGREIAKGCSGLTGTGSLPMALSVINIFLFFLKMTTKFTLEGSDGEQFKKRKKCDLSDIGCGLVYIR